MFFLLSSSLETAWKARLRFTGMEVYMTGSYCFWKQLMGHLDPDPVLEHLDSVLPQLVLYEGVKEMNKM